MIGRSWSEERGLTALLVTLVVNLFLLYPSTPAGKILAVVSDLLLTLLLLAGLLTMGGRRPVRLLFGVLIAATIGVRWAALPAWGAPLKAPGALLTLVSLMGITYVVRLQVSRPGPVTAHRIRGAIAGYLLIAAVFAYAYAFIEAMAPGSFQMPGWWSRDPSSWSRLSSDSSIRPSSLPASSRSRSRRDVPAPATMTSPAHPEDHTERIWPCPSR